MYHAAGKELMTMVSKNSESLVFVLQISKEENRIVLTSGMPYDTVSKI